MSEPTIKCPHCDKEIKLTESFAAPLIEKTKAEYQKRLAEKDEDIAAKIKSLAEEKENLDTQIAEKLKTERTKIAAEEFKKAELRMEDELTSKAAELGTLTELLNSKEAKLAEAQKAQADVLKKQRELDDEKRELELTIEKRVRETQSEIRASIQKETEEEFKFKVMEKEELISSMQKKIEDLKKKAEQGSQQLQGEVQELDLENILKTEFPRDIIEPVGKGEFGGDISQIVIDANGRECGIILWESKRTKNWSDAWLPKLRSDQRAAKAELAAIVSQALPKTIETFDWVDGVCVLHPHVFLPVAHSLRRMLIEVALVRKSSEGQQTKTEMIYQYITGPSFRQRVQAIVEAFSTMQIDLNKERKVITKQWAKREQQIKLVMESTVGLFGDVQGIAGQTLQEIEGLEMVDEQKQLVHKEN